MLFKGIPMNKLFISSALFLVFSLSAQADVTTHKNAIISLSFIENKTAYANQIAIANHAKAANLSPNGIQGITKSFAQMNSHEKAVTALSFNENNMSAANQAAINSHLKAGNLATDKVNGISKSFLAMDEHEKAAVALSFTENNQSPSIKYAVQQHLIRSQTK